MPSLKDLRVRIASVKSTQKITSAMKMVAAAKLKRAQVAAEQGRPYAESMERMLAGMLAGMSSRDNAPKLLAGHGREQKHLLVVVTSDRGLAGGFNANIAREARRKISSLQREGKEVKVLIIGRKGRDALRRDHGRLIIDTLGERHTQRRSVRARPRAFATPAQDVRCRRIRRLHPAVQHLQVGDQPGGDGEAGDPVPGRGLDAGGRCDGGSRRAASTRWSRMTTTLLQRPAARQPVDAALPGTAGELRFRTGSADDGDGQRDAQRRRHDRPSDADL